MTSRLFVVSKQKKQGLLFSLDSILALLLALLILLPVAFSLRSMDITIWSEISLDDLGMDYLALLEEKNILATSISQAQTADLQQFLNMNLNPNICMDVSLYDSGGELQLVETKTGCYGTEEHSRVLRTFIVEDTIYYAVAEVWFYE